MQIATGTYGGDGSTVDRLITTGLSGRIRRLDLFNRTSASDPNWKNDQMPGKSCWNFGGTPVAWIAFVGADFTVDFDPLNSGNPNQAGQTYDWTAWSE